MLIVASYMHAHDMTFDELCGQNKSPPTRELNYLGETSEADSVSKEQLSLLDRLSEEV